MDAVSFISESMIGNECINVTKPEVAQMLRASGHSLYFHEYLYTPEGSAK